MTKVAIIDNQQIFREGLHRLLEAESDLNVIISNNDISNISEDALQQVDVFIVDVHVAKEEAEIIKKRIVAQDNEQKIIIVSSETNKVDVTDIIIAGYHGYLLHEMSYTNFIEAVRTVIEGGIFIHPQVLHVLLSDYRQLVKGNRMLDRTEQTNTIERICTKRENEILQLLVNGNDNNSIAKELNISEKTVKNHLTNIFRKLEVRDRTQAAVLAIRNDWVQL